MHVELQHNALLVYVELYAQLKHVLLSTCGLLKYDLLLETVAALSCDHQLGVCTGCASCRI